VTIAADQTDEALAGPEPAPQAVHAAQQARDKARRHLLSLQEEDGFWKGELETNVTMEAEDLLMREFLGVGDTELTAQTARWIRSKQRADGTWATFYDGPGDLSTTIEAYLALRLAGDDPTEPHLTKAADFIRDQGGIENSRVFTRIWLALFGLWSWDDLPAMPPEIIFLPRWFPLNIYDWACWARQTVVPLTIVNALRPVRPLHTADGAVLSVDELRTFNPVVPVAAPRLSVTGAFQALDKLLSRYGRATSSLAPVRALRGLAMRRAAQWIVDRQEADGSWGGIQPPWVYSLMALHLLGYPLVHPVVAKGLVGLDNFTVLEQSDEGVTRRLEACQSPVWDTALAVIALADAGLPASDPRLTKAANWLVAEEIRVPGDWSVRRPRLSPSGWAFEFANDLYPDTDDTAEVVLALRRSEPADPGPLQDAVKRGVAWAVGMQSKDGGWGAFDADNTRSLILRLPFCDFGAVIDPPSADVTAHMLEMLGAVDTDGEYAQATAAGVQWLFRHQEADGSWFGRWGANHVYGTGAVLPALIAVGVPSTTPAIRRAVRFLEKHQNSDGGWGEDLRSYHDPRTWVGRGTSTASQTAWALLALLAVGEESVSLRRGVRFLMDTQRADGTWDEPQYTGTGFPGDFSINYHLYRLVFPLSALGRYVSRLRVIDLSAGASGTEARRAEAADFAEREDGAA
jgi:squalene-hopene/tetraprenyl-beta-curcumene cyclase